MKIAFLNCTKTKKPYKCTAEEMYSDSNLFSLSKQFVQKLGVDNFYILSCKHGLLNRNTLIEPYDVTLQGANETKRAEFGLRVYNQLLEQEWFKDVTEIHFLTSQTYHKFLIPLLDDNTKKIIVYGEGLKMGYKLHFLKQQLSRTKKLF